MKNKSVNNDLYSTKNIQAVILLFICFISLMSKAAQATDGISCGGKITTLGVHGTDRVMLQLSGMNTIVQICSLSATMGSTYPITPEQCKIAYSTLLTAYSLNKTITVWFDNVQTGTSCTTFAGWEVATARWVHLDGN